MKHLQITLAIEAGLSPSITLADDFKTIDGKEYKNVIVSRVEPDGIVLKTKSGISKVYFVELPKEIQERFHYNAASVAAQASQQNAGEEIATTINRLVKAGYIAKAQELLELSLDDYFVLQLAMIADKKVSADTTIAAWKQAGLRLPAEDTDEFYPYRNSPPVTEEEMKAVMDGLKERLIQEATSKRMNPLRRIWRWFSSR